MTIGELCETVLNCPMSARVIKARESLERMRIYFQRNGFGGDDSYSVCFSFLSIFMQADHRITEGEFLFVNRMLDLETNYQDFQYTMQQYYQSSLAEVIERSIRNGNLAYDIKMDCAIVAAAIFAADGDISPSERVMISQIIR